MVKEEIIAGLQNAVARGQQIEQAAQSFINAGYNPTEVREVASIISSGASNFTPQNGSEIPQPIQQQIPQPIQQNQFQSPQSPQNPQSLQYYQNNQQTPKPLTSSSKGAGKGKVILLSIILILLLIGLIATIFFKNGILSLLQ